MGTKAIEKGIITYIYLENFVTYSRVVVKPGRNLNVIIGPNGTGKSTIVCAIVLGLGGKPSTIGRAKHIAEYIRAGCDEAKIEIRLKNDKGKDISITRIFDKTGKTSWIIDGQTAHVKEVQKLTTELNIQVDNLCQFLPQDKVQDFSKMNAKELLENTERSVGDPCLYEYHMKLKNFRVKHKELEGQLSKKKCVLDSKMQEYEGMKEIVDNINEQRRTKKKMITLKQKKAWILYDQTRKHLISTKKQRDEIGAKRKAIEEKMKPINDKIDKTKNLIKMKESTISNFDNKMQCKTERSKTLLNKAMDYENEIKESELKCQRNIELEKHRDKEILLEQQTKNKLENDLSHLIQETGTEEDLKRRQQETLIHIEKRRNIIDKLTHENNALKRKEEIIEQNIRAQEREYQDLNIEAKRLELLRQRSMDTYKGVLWLRENKDKFQSKIHEPMLLNLNVKEASNAKYLENVIPFRDLIAFVCENKRDMNLLLQYLRDQQKLQVNVLHSDPGKNVRMESNIPIEDIARFGFKYYLISLVEAPSTIMKYLVSMYHLNNIPVGSDAIEDNIDRIPRSLTYFFSETNLYVINTSKYSGERSTRISQISDYRTLSIVLDKAKLQMLQRNIANFKKEREDIASVIKKNEEMICKENAELENFRSIRNKNQHAIQQIQALHTRINIVMKNIESLETGRVTEEQIKEKSTSEIHEILNRQLQSFEEYNSIRNECYELVLKCEESKLLLKYLQRVLVVKMQKIDDLKDQLKVIEKEYRTLDQDVRTLKNEADCLFKDALESTNGISPQDDKFKSFNTAFGKLPGTIQEIDRELQIAHVKVSCMGQTVDGEDVLKTYEKLEADIKDLKKFIDEKTAYLESMTLEIDTLRDKWLQPLGQLVEQINANFSTHFATMKCAGEVTLSHGDNIMDFDEYGLKICVKFRDADKLQELTRHHQSGGERAVATAIYMISIQELSRVPFRCVDEINQGMDTINEKRVFELLVKMTSKPGSSQYFLLTPKLVSGLTYSDTVTVHCVFNGPFVIPHTEFDTESYCRHLAKMYGKDDR